MDIIQTILGPNIANQINNMKNRESSLKTMGVNNSMMFLGGGKKGTVTGGDNEMFSKNK